MDMKKVFKINPHIVFSTKDGSTRVISLEEDNNELINLVGAAGECLKLFDGKKNLLEIKNVLESQTQVSGSEEDFLKMIDFFFKKNLIQNVD